MGFTQRGVRDGSEARPPRKNALAVIVCRAGRRLLLAGGIATLLAVAPATAQTLDDELASRLRDQIRRGASPRHVPARIVSVPDLPRTLSGKIVELAVGDVVHGRPVRNRDALANPEALDHFRDLEELTT